MIAGVFDWLPGIITAIFSGGVVGSVVALLKIRPEAGQIVVTAAQGALLVQTGVIEDLRKEIERLNRENSELRARITELEDTLIDMRQEQLTIKKDQDRHDAEVRALQHK